ncbi:ribonuclease 3-like protein 3 [Rosa rugosa]|uniref:ribonuclease 3-like protein 3 n=1 Tax=Rosa rugosa TaxID=74645 RepID=UPI002B403C73|nr:ribonuclease 3-like protein 3 [Rosa rugosa]
MDVGQIAQIIDYQFTDPSLLIRACTHSSYDPTFNNGALETLGDLTLGLHVGSLIYDTDPENITECHIHTLKSVNVDNENLARACVRNGLDQHLMHGDVNEVNREVLKLRQQMLDYPIHSNGRIDEPKFLADMVEAIIGAVWVDSQKNLATTGHVIGKILGNLNIEYENYRQKPTEQLWSSSSVKARFNLLEKMDCQDGNPRCRIIMNNNQVIADVRYSGSRKVLRNRAASDAIQYLRDHHGLQI